MKTESAGPVILIVDDQPENIHVLHEMLKEKCRLTAATDGLKALEIAASDNRPDLILLDIMMPGMDGYEVCRRLKKNPRTRHIPVIFLTARDQIEDETRGFAVGAVDYLSKPFHPERLEARLFAHLKNHQISDDPGEKKEQMIRQSRLDHIQESYEMYLQKLRGQIDSAVDIYKNLVSLKRTRFQFDVSWKQRTVADLGGDFIDIRESDDSLSILVADVAGHDMGSSYHTILLKAFFDENCHRENDGITLFRLLNRHLLESGREERMITAVFVRVRRADSSCEIVSAAHPWAVIRREKAPRAERLFRTGGAPLGLREDSTFVSRKIKLASKDRLFLHTDGVVGLSRLDMETGDLRKLYARGLDDFISAHRRLPLEESVAAVWEDLLQFCRHKPKDDILLFGLEMP